MKVIVPFLLVSLTAIAAPGTPLRAPDGSNIADWQTAPNPKKPYIAQIWTPTAKPLPLLEDSPHDHVHHHGLMFALAVDGTDFWGEVGAPNLGTQVPATSTRFPAGDGFTQILHWTAPDGTRLLDETRTVRVRATGSVAKGDAVHWLDWRSDLTPAPGCDSVKLSGSHYFGLGLRFAPAWSNHGVFRWQDTKGQITVRGDEKLTPGRWCAAEHTSDGQPLTVLMLSHPDNPRAGAWFTMSKPFCYLSATYDLEKNPFVLAKGKSWTLRHSLAVLGKSTDAAALDLMARDWQASLTKLFPVEPKPEQP